MWRDALLHPCLPSQSPHKLASPHQPSSSSQMQKEQKKERRQKAWLNPARLLTDLKNGELNNRLLF